MKKSDFLLYILTGFFGVLGVISMIAFGSVMFSDNATGIVGELFGTENKKDTLEFLGWMIGGLAGPFFGLLFFNKQATTQDKTNELTGKGHIQNRLNAAIEHLSNKESPIRTASFHELFRLAKDNKDDYAQTVLGVLCTHLRQRTDYEYYLDYEIYDHSEEVKILARILFGQETGKVFDGLHFDLRGTNLTGIDFQGIGESKEINFSFTELSHAIFNGTILSGANFYDATLHESHFVKTNLQGADLRKTELNLADLIETDFSNANMEKAELRHANCSKANFHKATLLYADLREADLREAKNLQTAILLGAKYSKGTNGKGTQFPDGFKPEEHDMELLP